MNLVLNSKKSSFFQMAPYTKVKSKTEEDKATVFKYGLMVPSMKASGMTMSLVEEENSFILMVTFMMVRYYF